MDFTDTAVAGLELPPGKTEHFEWDPTLPSFGVRLRPGGSKRYYVRYRVGSKQRSESLGDTRKLRLAAARKAAQSIFAKLTLDQDPRADRTKAKTDATAAKRTLGSVADRYLAIKEGTLRPASYKAAVRHFRDHWESLRSTPLGAIKRADVAAGLQELTIKNGRVAAARARANLSALFGWAIGEGMVEANPVSGTNNPDKDAKPRERVLDDAEIRAIWNACADDAFGAIVRLLILTGCRREEIGGLLWNEINLETGVLTIDGTRTKNHRELILTLPPMALEILRSSPRAAGQVYVFGNKRNTGGFGAWSYSTLALNSRIATTAGQPLRPWRLHDLRRTMRSGLGRIGVAPHVAELVIGHVKGGIEATYDRHTYGPEIKTALLRWAEHVAGVVEERPSNVVSLERSQG